MPCLSARSEYQTLRRLERAKGNISASVKSDRARRELLGLRQAEAARMTGLGQATINRIRAGSRISAQTEKKILREIAA